MKYLQMICLTLLMLLISGQVWAVDLAADQIMDKYFAKQPKTFVGKMKMEIIKANKEDRVATFKIWAKGKEKALMRFLTPIREKGTACLKKDDNMFFYLPSIERTMRIPGNKRLMGSDFSGTDIFGLDLSKYESFLLGSEQVDGVDYYILSLESKARKNTYAALKVWMRKEDFLITRQEFYTSSGKLLQTLEFKNYRQDGGCVYPKKMTMENKMVEDQYTVVTVLEGSFDSKIPNNLFTINFLKRPM